MQKLAEKNGHINSQVVVTPSQNNQVKSRRSLDQNLLKNPFSTPNKTKKVKINTKLNRSQEIYEHHMQILSSPGIPHDPSKKPMKPVLKSPARTNSINPFYDKQLSIWQKTIILLLFYIQSMINNGFYVSIRYICFISDQLYCGTNIFWEIK